ncbi:hypothetical protein ACVBIO_13435 [Shewanella sp. 0m-8]
MMEKHLFNKYVQNEFIHSKTNEKGSALVEAMLVEESIPSDEQEDETSSYILGYN